MAGGGVRRLGQGVAEIKRMYVCPRARSRGVAAALLRTLEDAARYARLHIDPPRHRAETGPCAAALPGTGYVEVPAYNDNPFACFWERGADLSNTVAVPTTLSTARSGTPETMGR